MFLLNSLSSIDVATAIANVPTIMLNQSQNPVKSIHLAFRKMMIPVASISMQHKNSIIFIVFVILSVLRTEPRPHLHLYVQLIPDVVVYVLIV